MDRNGTWGFETTHKSGRLVLGVGLRQRGVALGTFSQALAWSAPRLWPRPRAGTRVLRCALI